MPLEIRQQILGKTEASEGVDAAPGASDAFNCYDPKLADEPDTEQLTPAGASLSKAPVPTGRVTRTLTFKTDLFGSGDTAVPIVTEPTWARLVRAASFHTVTLKKLTLGTVTGNGYVVGEEVTQSSGTIRGIVVGCFTSGNVPVAAIAASGGYLVIYVLAGTFTAAATTGVSSGSTNTLSAVANYGGYGAVPTSLKLVNLTTGAWSGTPPAVGDNVRILDASTGLQLGNLLIVTDNGSMVDFDATLLWGSIANGNVVQTLDGASEATLSAAPVQTHGQSMSFRRNLDGRRKGLLGARGDFTLSGDVGKRLQFDWKFIGDLGTTVNTPPVTTSALSTYSAPRLLGGIVGVVINGQFLRIPIKSVSLEMANEITADLDANRSGGSRGSLITNRTPALVIETNQTHGEPDWEALRDAGTLVPIACILGTTRGNICGIIAPQCQIAQATENSQKGIATFTVRAEPKRVRESGDDELALVQL